MWKYVAFVLLIVFSVSAELEESTAGTSSHVPSTVEDELTTASTSPTTASPTSPTTASPTSPTTAPPTSPTTEDPTPEVTTVSPPPTTALPPPNVGKYSIHEKNDENKTCLRVEMALRVSIHDLQTSYNFPGNASTEGSDCNGTDNTQVLNLTAHDLQQSLTFIFVQEDKKNYVKDIIFTYYTPEMKKAVNSSGHFFSSAEGNSYLCNSDVAVKMENVTLTFSSVHVQAFGADTFGRAEECDADDKVGDIVPIAVGCALGALVIIVLIAYLVGRRRSHQKGYQSV